MMKLKEKEELQLRLKDNLVVTSLDGEGLIFEVDTQKTFWVNETAAFVFKLLEANHEGIPLFSVKSLLQEQYSTDDGNEITQDLATFVNRLEQYDLVSVEPSSNGANEKKFKNPNGETIKSYSKPIINREIAVLPITGVQVRAAHMAASRSAAVSRASAAGFRGFR